MSGIEVLKALKEQNNKTPVVMLTTSTDENDLRDCLKYGARLVNKSKEGSLSVNSLRNTFANIGVISCATIIEPVLISFNAYTSSSGTVKLHVKSILKKLSLSSRVEVAVMVTKKSYCETFA
jgi:two-component system nitrate/nitrite response regulator NarL